MFHLPQGKPERRWRTVLGDGKAGVKVIIS
jgi:hypothetical protein